MQLGGSMLKRESLDSLYGDPEMTDHCWRSRRWKMRS